MKKNVLIISLYYPPINSIASNRIESFAKYLNKNKYNVTVLTLRDNNSLDYEETEGLKIYRLEDKSLFKAFKFDKKRNFIIHKLKAGYNLMIKSSIKEYRGWEKLTLKKAYELFENQQFNILLSSYAPVASHNIALEIKEKYPSIKWIADMRDEMSLNPYLNINTLKKNKKVEEKILRKCDALTAVSLPVLKDFMKLSKNSKILFKEIRNGYDFEVVEKKLKNNFFTISYIGSFYGDINPNNFFKAIKELDLKKLKIRIVGNSRPFTILKELKDKVEVFEKVSHEKALEFMRESDSLLMIYPTNGRKGVYTGKLFEYLGMLKPIVALVDKDDVAAKLIIEANAGFVADNRDIEEIKIILKQAYQEWEEKIDRNYNIEVIKAHHRKEQVIRLEKLIEELLING